MIVSVDWPIGDELTRFAPGCLDHMIDEVIPVSIEGHPAGQGIIRGYELRDRGRSIVVDVELPGAAAAAIAGGGAAGPVSIGERGVSWGGGSSGPLSL